MSDDKKTPAEQVLDQLKDPWDWTAALVGAAGGAVVTIFLHGTDLGHSIPAGALTVVAGRRSIASSFSRTRLRKRAKNLLAILQADEGKDKRLVTELVDWTAKWEAKVIPNDLFEKKIADIAERDNRRKANAPENWDLPELNPKAAKKATAADPGRSGDPQL